MSEDFQTPAALGYAGPVDDGWRLRPLDWIAPGTHADGSPKPFHQWGWEVVMTAGWHGPMPIGRTTTWQGNDGDAWHVSLECIAIQPAALHHLADLLAWLPTAVTPTRRTA